MAENQEHPAHGGSFWSGTITFGLVSIPVDLYSAHRPNPAALRLIDQRGIALHRRYFCPKDHRPLTGKQIVRGYEIEEGRFVVVDDAELADLEPKKSREIDLRCFVSVAEVDPAYFQHAYFLVPSGSVTKAYRLLAEIMERHGRAGIATFVMRDREHLVAILAEGGILRAETLRFAEELRAPEDIGLPQVGKAPARMVSRFRAEIKRLTRKEFDQELLHDRHARRLLDLVRRKLKAGEDVVEKPAEEVREGGEIIDLIAIIKERFAAGAKDAG